MNTAAKEHGQFRDFEAFYPFYLGEHSNRSCRRLHFVGSLLAIVALVSAILTTNPWWLLAGLVAGYALAWVGHFFFERNRPATFKYPWYSLRGDLRMFRQILVGQIDF